MRSMLENKHLNGKIDKGGRGRGLIPLFKTLVVDECLPAEPFHTTQSSLCINSAVKLGLTGFTDGSISAIANTLDATIITRDRGFHYAAAKEGEPPKVLIVVPDELSATCEDIERVVHDAERLYESTWVANPDPAVTTYIDYRPPFTQTRTATPPPTLVCSILEDLDERRILETKHLVDAWSCSYQAAYLRARILVEDGWLRRQKRGNRWRYSRGGKLSAYYSLRDPTEEDA